MSNIENHLHIPTCVLVAVILCGTPLCAQNHGKQPSETSGNNNREIEAIVFSIQPADEGDIRYLREHRHRVIPVLKNWITDPRAEYGNCEEKSLYYLGLIGSDEDVSFLESCLYEQYNEASRRYGLVGCVARALARINTERSVGAVIKAISVASDSGRRTHLVHGLELSTRDEAAKYTIDLAWSDHAEGVQVAAFEAGVNILQMTRGDEARDALLVRGLDHPTVNVARRSIWYMSQYGAVGCLSAARALQFERHDIDGVALRDLETAVRLLEALSSEHPNRTLLVLLGAEPKRYYLFVPNLLTVEDGVAEHLRQVYEEKIKVTRITRQTTRDILSTIRRLGGTLTEEEKHRWFSDGPEDNKKNHPGETNNAQTVSIANESFNSEGASGQVLLEKEDSPVVADATTRKRGDHAYPSFPMAAVVAVLFVVGLIVVLASIWFQHRRSRANVHSSPPLHSDDHPGRGHDNSPPPGPGKK